jgi:diketogulonate reductase-like aldo/keto reductase
VVGSAIAQSVRPRSEIFITTKYLPSHSPTSASSVLDVLRKSLKPLNQDVKDDPYIDLMLVHTAWGGSEGRAEIWRALTEAQKEGWIRDIGVSNL